MIRLRFMYLFVKNYVTKNRSDTKYISTLNYVHKNVLDCNLISFYWSIKVGK